MESLRLLLPVLLAVGTSLVLDRSMEARGLLPPNFRISGAPGDGVGRVAFGRTAALVLMALIFWVGVFAPLGVIGLETDAVIDGIAIPDLFALHVVFVIGLVVWFSLGFLGSKESGSIWRRQLGFSSRDIAREVGIGLAAGVLGWLAVIACLLSIALAVYLLAGEDALPTQPPEMISWVVALPVAVRLGLSLSAGFVEETFFRGFLQPRIGVGVSSLLFVLAHLSYDNPFLLVGVALLSLLFAGLVRWRQNIWAAITAHTVFDAIQLLFVIPNAIDLLDEADGPVATALSIVPRL